MAVAPQQNIQGTNLFIKPHSDRRLGLTAVTVGSVTATSTGFHILETAGCPLVRWFCRAFVGLSVTKLQPYHVVYRTCLIRPAERVATSNDDDGRLDGFLLTSAATGVISVVLDESVAADIES